ncbi:MAG: CS1-pili formation C-terminal domain-containing protein [Pseudomonadota bacterium]
MLAWLLTKCVSPLLLLSVAIPCSLQASPAPDRTRYLQDIRAGQANSTTPAPDRSQYLRDFVPTPVRTVLDSTKKRRAATSAPAFVPPGFEDLLEPQTTLVDVYYGGAFLTATTATFTPTEIRFLNPDDLVARIPDILDPDAVSAFLRTDMPTNSELVCLTALQTNCGRIEAETVEVIFDDGQFRADLFLAPGVLAVRSAGPPRFLPRSSAGVSLLNTTTAAINGQSSESTSYNLGNSTTLAVRESRLLAVSNVSSGERLSFDTLALQREVNGQQFQAGLFRSSPGNLLFINQADFAGINLASSLDTRRDLDQSAGSALQVFLESRSRVDILKDGRLVSTRIYETGNQIVDTSQLPGGAYEIVLRIRDSFGETREETRFYVKTNRLPPMDQLLYFVDVGEFVASTAESELPRGTGEHIVRAGLAKRITSAFGGELGVLSTAAGSVLETGLFHLARAYDFRLNGAFGDDGSFGLNTNLRARVGALSINFSGRKTWTGNQDSMLGGQLTQSALNVTVPLGRSTLNFSARYNKRESVADRNLGLRYDFPTFRFDQRFLDANLQVTKDNDNLLVLLNLSIALRGKHWQHQAAARLYREEPQVAAALSGIESNLTSIWQDQELFRSDVALTVRANDERDDQTLESELDISSNFGRANLNAVYSAETGEHGYGANLFTSLIANKDTFRVGSRNQAQSAIVLDIKGEVRDAFFDVQVNGMVRGNVAIGTKTVVGLAPFDTYRINLLPRGDSIVDFPTNTRQATLYPGNVVTLTWDVTRVLIAFGQVVDEAGRPVSNAIIDGVVGLATTDEFGLFQAEIKSNLTSLRVRTREQTCKVLLPDYDTSQLVVTLGELVCRRTVQEGGAG